MRNLDPTAAIEFKHEDTYREEWQMRPDQITALDIDGAVLEAGTLSRLDLPNVPGLYLVLNRTNGLVYVGRATRMRDRVGNHFSQLKTGVHSNAAWRADFLAHGASAFGAAVITYALGHWLYLAEMAALRVLKTRDCYNVQNIDFIGRAALSAEYINRLTDYAKRLADQRNQGKP